MIPVHKNVTEKTCDDRHYIVNWAIGVILAITAASGFGVAYDVYGTATSASEVAKIKTSVDIFHAVADERDKNIAKQLEEKGRNDIAKIAVLQEQLDRRFTAQDKQLEKIWQKLSNESGNKP